VELRMQLRRAAARKTAWLAATFVLVAVVILAWQSLATVRYVHSQNPAGAVSTSTPLLDRNAERQAAASPRSGGPGGQIGDVPPAP